MSQALTTQELIEIVKHKRIMEAQEQTELEPEAEPSILDKLKEFIEQCPNKLFWISSFVVACIAIITIPTFYHLPWTQDKSASKLDIQFPDETTDDDDENDEDGKPGATKPAFTVFLFGFLVVCFHLFVHNFRDYPQNPFNIQCIGYLIHCFREACYEKTKKDASKLKSGDTKPSYVSISPQIPLISKQTISTTKNNSNNRMDQTKYNVCDKT